MCAARCLAQASAEQTVRMSFRTPNLLSPQSPPIYSNLTSDPIVYPSIHLSIYPSIHLSIHLSVCLACLSVCLSVGRSVCLSVCMSLFALLEAKGGSSPPARVRCPIHHLEWMGLDCTRLGTPGIQEVFAVVGSKSRNKVLVPRSTFLLFMGSQDWQSSKQEQ